MLVASGCDDGLLRFWDEATGAVIKLFEGHSAAITGVSWCPDGMRLASGFADRSVRLWAVETGAAILVLEGDSGAITGLQWS
jgi:WD40 repeat protein